METVVYIIFTLLMFIVFMYSLSQLNLLINYLKGRQQGKKYQELDLSDPEGVPMVTVQLPLYNEKPVAERLLKNMARLDYPKQRLEIQVLDDSTDDSVALVRKTVELVRAAGVDIRLLRRKKRTDFKAGALREGLEVAKGEFIAIFDSDFLPQADWLKRTLPYLMEKDVGAVQTRWGHLNRAYSLLTQLQAFLLDFHFVLEQSGRNFGNHFINFNGTAGIWRKTCILDAGNWQGDTLTEDLDLSYRAQMKGWKFVYLEAVESPAELPVTIAAAKSQQFRWNKGAAENFRKNFHKLLRTKHIPVVTKFQSFFHLFNSSLFPVVLLLGIFSVPLLFLQAPESWVIWMLFGLSSSIFIFFCSYWISFSKIHGSSFRNLGKFFFLFFAFFAIALGLSLHNSVAVAQGYLKKKTEFIRTPKFNIRGKKRFAGDAGTGFTWQLFVEILLFIYFLFGLICGLIFGNYSLLHFHLMLSFGFGYVIYHSLDLFKPKSKKSGT